jgi:hypothetical protein
MDCISLAQDGKKWWTVLNVVVTSGFPEVRVISRLSEDCWLLIKDCAVLGWSVSIRAITFTIMIRSVNRPATTKVAVYKGSTRRRTGLFQARSLLQTELLSSLPFRNLRATFIS